jgi:zinc protease
MLVLDGTPAPGAKISELEAQLRNQVRQLQQQPVTAAELARVKAQVVAADVYERDSVFYQAMKIGMLESSGQSWRLLDDYVDNVRAVTAEQVQQVARKYLDEERMTVATLVPLPTDAAAAPPRHSHGVTDVH